MHKFYVDRNRLYYMCKFLDWFFDKFLPDMIRMIISVIKWLWSHIILIWYLVLLGLSTRFVIDNFTEITTFTFFEEFNGKNLIFVLWLLLLILPLVRRFEGFGVKVDFGDTLLSNSYENAVQGLQIANSQQELQKKEEELEQEYKEQRRLSNGL